MIKELLKFIIIVPLVIFIIIVLYEKNGHEMVYIYYAVGAIALFLSPLIPYIAYRYQIRQSENLWLDTFRTLHADFWNNQDMAIVRKWIACDEAYEEIRPILLNRLNHKQVSKEDYDKLEMIDKFGAFMVRATKIIPLKMTNEQLRTLHALHYDYWLQKCIKDRTELADYLREFWPSLRKILNNTNNSSGIKISS